MENPAKFKLVEPPFRWTEISFRWSSRDRMRDVVLSSPSGPRIRFAQITFRKDIPVKNLVIALLTVGLLGLITMAHRPLPMGNVASIATLAANESSAGLPPFSCTCSCGKNCDGSCASHYVGCNASEAMDCIANCCDSAPTPDPRECGDLF